MLECRMSVAAAVRTCGDCLDLREIHSTIYPTTHRRRPCMRLRGRRRHTSSSLRGRQIDIEACQILDASMTYLRNVLRAKGASSDDFSIKTTTRHKINLQIPQFIKPPNP